MESLRNSKGNRYWIGYLRVSKAKYKLVNLFCTKEQGTIRRWLIPRLFFLTRMEEQKIFDNDFDKQDIRWKRSNSEYHDAIISREFLKKK